MSELLTLSEWDKLVYKNNSHSLNTLRRWARDGYIYPAPQKHGREYLVEKSAIYRNPHRTTSKLQRAIACSTVSPQIRTSRYGSSPEKIF